MGFPTDRVILFDRSMNPLSELAPSEVYSRVRKEELNGEHSLVITTSRQLQEGWRALTVDGTGKWREWVVTETPQEHTAGPNAIGTYRFVWSLQYDLTRSYYHDMTEAVSIGIGSSCAASEAAGHVLTGVSWWTVGTCDGADIIPGGYLSADERTNPIASPKSNKTNSRGRVTGDSTQTGCVFIRESAWSKLSKLVECTAYEVDAEIVVSSAFVVTERRLCLREHLGNAVPLRRFDWGHDVTDIKRTPDPGPYYCRVVPLGKTEKEYADDDVTEFDWPMDITEETGTEQNPGPYWIQDDEAAQVFRIKNPDGTYDYPTVAVEYRSEDDPELLLAAAQADLHNHTRPNVTYEANVLQFARAGMDAQGVTLGDEIQIVDYGFNPDAALRLQGRVTSIEIDELSPETGTSLTIGNLEDGATDLISSVSSQLDSLVVMHGHIREDLSQMDTTAYVQSLMDRLNTEIAGTGGYTYLTEGEGLVTYDRAVADPLIGSEATRVVQLKGGYLRIADTKKNPFSGIDDWDFKTILDAGHIVSDLITTVKIVAGYIGNATNGNYWNLDTGELRMESTKTMVGNQTLANYIDGIADASATSATQALDQATILSRLTGGYTTEGLYISNGHLYINASAINSGYLSASYIQGGTLKLGGANNVNGVMQVYDESGNLLSTIDKSGANIVGEVKSRYKYKSLKSLSSEDYGVVFEAGLVDLINNTFYQRVHQRPNTTYSTGNVGGFTVKQTTSSFDYTSGFISLIPSRYGGAVVSNDRLTFLGGYSSSGIISELDIDSNGIYLNVHKSGSSTIGIGTSADFAFTDGHVNFDGDLGVAGSVSLSGTLSCSGTVSSSIKSRVVKTNNYGNRLLYCYETSSPTFGDIGSSTLDGEGFSYIQIDDIFSETSHTDYSYQVFLQKCGQGDLWVAEKHCSYFVVQGTPHLKFDWELKARQKDLETLRLDDRDIYDANDFSVMSADTPENSYSDYVMELEEIYASELLA